MKTNVIIYLSVFAMMVSCKKSEPIVVTQKDFHNTVEKVIETMIHDIFSPPVASRIFAYPNIAAYEIIAQNNLRFKSLEGQISGLTTIPKPKDSEAVNYQLAALIAHLDLSRKLVFSEGRITSYRDSLYQIWDSVNTNEFNNSKDYGLLVSNHIQEWMDADNYKQTRTFPKFRIDPDDASRWQPTPPAYMDGIEPHWNKIRTFVIDSAEQFKPIPPPTFSMETNSTFFKELKEVYDISNEITEKGDASEEIQIAQFWDCNPYVSITRGHLMFAAKKITPGAHWMLIAKIAAEKSKYNFDQTLMAHTKTAITIFDAFISCWDEKYRSNLIRPETLINAHFNDNWKPILQTPPFPEYTSGHSVVSGSAATALTSIFGDNFQFNDDSEVPYGLPIRSFNSFNEAADEAALSRLYGGIHYRAAIEVGVKQGRDLGAFIINNLKMLNN